MRGGKEGGKEDKEKFYSQGIRRQRRKEKRGSGGIISTYRSRSKNRRDERSTWGKGRRYIKIRD